MKDFLDMIPGVLIFGIIFAICYMFASVTAYESKLRLCVTDHTFIECNEIIKDPIWYRVINGER